MNGTLRASIDGMQVRQALKLAPGEAKTVTFSPETYSELKLAHPRLWWPYQMGEPHLYAAKLEFVIDGQVSDSADVTFGIREATSELTDKGYRLFKINGRKVLIRGAAWAPDMFLRWLPERVGADFAYVRDMGLNTVRLDSPAFTERDMRAFLDEAVDHERRRLADRLEADSARLAELVRKIPSSSPAPSPEWTGHEVLAHIAVLSKFYGTVTYRVGSGKLSRVELLEAVQSRDPAGAQLSSLPADELLVMAQSDHQRTITYLRSADSAAMQRRAILYEGFSMSAAEIAQLPLCAHLEIHLDQLEQTLRP